MLLSNKLGSDPASCANSADKGTFRRRVVRSRLATQPSSPTLGEPFSGHPENRPKCGGIPRTFVASELLSAEGSGGLASIAPRFSLNANYLRNSLRRSTPLAPNSPGITQRNIPSSKSWKEKTRLRKLSGRKSERAALRGPIERKIRGERLDL